MLHLSTIAALAASLLLVPPLVAHAAARAQDAPAVTPPVVEPQLSSGDQRKLSRTLSEFFEARRDNESDLEARADLEALIADWEKKDRAKRSFLALVPDLEAALRAATPYKDSDVRRKGTVVTESFDEPFGGEITYAIQAPAKYSSRTTWPLVLSIPAEGESPENHLKEHWQNASIREQAVLVAIGMPAATEIWNEMGTPENGGGVPRTMHVMREVMRRAAIDPDRVFLTGKGRGVEAALAIAGLFPDRFAGVVGRTGDAGELAPHNFKNLPTFFAGGGEQVTAFAAKSEELGHDNVEVAPDADEAAVWTWMSERRRAAYPASVVIAPRTPVGSKAYWLEIMSGIDPATNPRLEGTIDRSTNTITLRGERVTQVQLYLNDHLVDLSRPVRVVVNGVEHENNLPRRFTTMLETAWRSGDMARVYTASHIYDVPEARPE